MYVNLMVNPIGFDTVCFVHTQAATKGTDVGFEIVHHMLSRWLYVSNAAFRVLYRGMAHFHAENDAIATKEWKQYGHLNCCPSKDEFGSGGRGNLRR